jgi:type IV pilus assembly protein PilV
MVARNASQSGVALLEALIGILIFSLGILAMVAMQAAAVNAVADAQYRIEAANAANQLLSHMWVNVDRSSGPNLQTSLLTFEHQTTGAPAGCNFSGPTATNQVVKDWLNYVNYGGPSGRSLLPNPEPVREIYQQIEVDTGASNRVTITLCWRAPTDPTPHRHTVVAYIN